MLKFIAYDGTFPNLCSGILTVELDGELFSITDCLIPGGGVTFTKDWEAVVKQGPWTIDPDVLPAALHSYPLIYELAKLANDNIPMGCCGGCV